MLKSGMPVDEAVLIDLHLRFSTHREEIEVACECRCFDCLQPLPTTEISEWIDENTTAICPRCGIDSVLPGPAEPDVLRAMHTYWFGKEA